MSRYIIKSPKSIKTIVKGDFIETSLFIEREKMFNFFI